MTAHNAQTRRAATALGMTADALAESDREALLAAFPLGSTVYTYVTTVARSGMSRRLAVVASVADTAASGGTVRPRNVTGLVSRLLGYRWNDDGTMTVPGGGMDMGFHVAYALSQTLHADGYALPHRWL